MFESGIWQRKIFRSEVKEGQMSRSSSYLIPCKYLAFGIQVFILIISLLILISLYLYSIELAKPILENLNNNFNYSDNHHHHSLLYHHHQDRQQNLDSFLFLNNRNTTNSGDSNSNGNSGTITTSNINNGNNLNTNANDSYVAVKEKLHLPHYIRAIINWIGESAIIFANRKENQLMVNEEERNLLRKENENEEEKIDLNNEERKKLKTNNIEQPFDRNKDNGNEDNEIDVKVNEEEEIENNIYVKVANDNEDNNDNVMGLFPTITTDSIGWQFTVAGRLLIAICFISYILAIINTVAIGLEQRTVLIILTIIFALIFAGSLTALLFAILTTTLANGETFQLNPWNSLLVMIVLLSALEVKFFEEIINDSFSYKLIN